MIRELILGITALSLITASVAAPAASRSGETGNGEPIIGQIQFDDGAASPAASGLQSIQVESHYVDTSQAADEAQRLIQQSPDTTVLSSDDEAVLARGASAGSRLNQSESDQRFFILPLGDLVDHPVARSVGRRIDGTVERANQVTAAIHQSLTKLNDSFRSHVVSSIANDKIGFMVVTYNFSMETVRWIHATHLSNFEKSANVVYSFSLAMVFSINKDMWATVTKPIQKQIRKILGMSTTLPSHPTGSDLLIKLLANIAVGSTQNLGRVPILSIEKIASHTFSANDIMIPIYMSVLTAIAGMVWSENVASVNQETHPSAKFVARRMVELRSLTMGTFASTAMLLSYDQYGIKPWLVLAVVGASGVPIYFNSKKLANWIESMKLSDKVDRLAVRIRTATSAVLNSQPARRCEMLF
jgi:hypothetical protein